MINILLTIPFFNAISDYTIIDKRKSLNITFMIIFIVKLYISILILRESSLYIEIKLMIISLNLICNLQILYLKLSITK